MRKIVMGIVPARTTLIQNLPVSFFISCHTSSMRLSFTLLLLSLLTCIALLLRIHRIGSDNRVVWDETHFGRFATHYINHMFYLDVHPPLGKLMLAFGYWVFGYRGGFGFDSGAIYPDSVPFVAMRYIQALIGTTLVPLTFLLARYMHLPYSCAWVAACFVAFDNALVGISRIIVLDNMMHVANCLAVCAYLHLRRSIQSKLYFQSWPAIICLGVTLGFVCCIKLSGLITLAAIGMFVAFDIVTVNCKASWTTAALCKSAIALMAIPALVYTVSFAIHFHIIRNYTPESDHMGSEYVAQLNNSAIEVQSPAIYSDSFVVLRSSIYPYEYISSYTLNNSSDHLLATRRRFAIEDYLGIQLTESNRYVSDGAVNKEKKIRDLSKVSLFVPKTKQYLSVLGLNSKTYQRSQIGFNEISGVENIDQNARWRIKVLDKSVIGTADSEVIPIATKFRLCADLETTCELAIDYENPMNPDAVTFPRQYPFRCADKNQGTVWNFEHQICATTKPVASLQPFLKRRFGSVLLSYSRLMKELNGMLVSNPDLYTPVESSPISWPFLAKPMPMVEWSGAKKKYMLVGNPILWWLSALVAIFIHPLATVINLGIRKRSCGKIPTASVLWHGNLLWVLWAANYFPFLMLSRVTYLHHYLPSLYFGLLLLAVYVDWAVSLLTESCSHSKYRPKILVAIFVSVVFGYFYVAPLTYGTTNPCNLARYRFLPYWRTCVL